MKHKIYVASSWRNVYYPDVVAKLRETGHEDGKGQMTAINDD